MTMNLIARIFAAALPLLLVFGAVDARAQEEFSKEHLRAAQKVIEVARAAEGFDEILPVMAEQTKSLFIRSNPAITREIEEATTNVAIKMAARRPELDRIVQEIWARRFTIEELEEINTFYASPTGTKLAKMSPEIIALSVGAAKQWGDALATEMVTLVREELKKQGHSL
ncbi:MAG: hypothetical protein C0606_01210 [Hyphomicrobiales bacterium]|nr:MAG: hypothetical protein C0606_01210 [Hyphomicrobiales bacterium]